MVVISVVFSMVVIHMVDSWEEEKVDVEGERGERREFLGVVSFFFQGRRM